jgi:ribonuclease HI
MSRYTVDVPSVQVLTIRTSCQSATYQQSDDNVGVVGLNLAFSSDYHEATPKRLIKTFDCCGHYFIRCNPCFKSDLISCQGGPLVCHRYRVIYTDGSCLDNGTANAAAGVGIAFGTKVEARSWMLVGDDPTGQRNNHTNQRAELLAAIHGIQSIATWTSTNRPCPDRKSHAEKKTMVWVIATDSEYVVKGMTKWLPMWKVGGPELPRLLVSSDVTAEQQHEGFERPTT